MALERVVRNASISPTEVGPTNTGAHLGSIGQAFAECGRSERLSAGFPLRSTQPTLLLCCGAAYSRGRRFDQKHIYPLCGPRAPDADELWEGRAIVVNDPPEEHACAYLPLAGVSILPASEYFEVAH